MIDGTPGCSKRQCRACKGIGFLPDWTIVEPLAKAQVLGGVYLRSADGRVVIFARRYRLGHKGDRSYRIEFRTVEYLDGATYATGGKNRTLYEGGNLEKAKAAS